MAVRASQHRRCCLQWLLVGIIGTAGSLAATNQTGQPRTHGSIAGSRNDDRGTVAGIAALEAKTADDSREARVQGIIHATSLLTGLADAGLAQLPVMGRMIVPSIQAGMVAVIGRIYGCYLDFANALALVTYLLSRYTGTAVATELIGLIPGLGNGVKGISTALSTEGIGQLALPLLRCEGGSGPAGEDSLSLALAKGSENVKQVSESARQLFHIVFDQLGSLNLTSRSRWSMLADMEGVWQLVKHRFFGQSQAQILAEVEIAASQVQAGNQTSLHILIQIVAKHAWNLEVMERAFAALIHSPHQFQACASVDVVAQRLWIPGQTDARGISAPYLLHCMQHADVSTQREVARSAAQMLVDTRGGAQGGLLPSVMGQALELLALTVEGFVEQQGHGALDVEELRAAIPAAITALGRGQAAACGATRALLRAERTAATAAGHSSSGASVRHLSALDRLQAQTAAAESCLRQLREELVQQLTLSSLPGSAMRPKPSTSSPSSAFGFTLGGSSRAHQLEEKLKSAVVGQRCMLERLWDVPGHVRLRYRGIWGHDKPLVLLLTGPSGTGKTMLARSLGEVLLGRPISELEAQGRFKTFHMNTFVLKEDQKSFFGPPKGIMGTGDLPQLLKKWPDAVILLDEVEKAHHSFASALLKVFGEHGAVYDPKTGQDIPATNATFVLTSNLGKDLIARHAAARTKSVGDPDCVEYGRLRDDVRDALKNTYISGRGNFFSESEMRSRLTDVLPFLPFSQEEVQRAVVRFLEQEAQTFEKSPQFMHASLAWEPEVVPLFAAEYAQRQEEGLRGVQIQLQTRVREVIDCAVATGLLQHYGEVVLWVRPHPDSSKAQLDLHVVPRRAWSRPIAITQDSNTNIFASTLDTFKHYAHVKITGQAWHESSSSSWQEGGLQHEFERLQQWDWELYWQQLQEVLWEYKFAIAIALVAIIAVALTAGPALPAAPISAVGSAGGSVAALLQLAVPLGGFAAAALGAGVAWYHGWELLGLAVVLLMSWPVLRYFMCSRQPLPPEWQERHIDRGAAFAEVGRGSRIFAAFRGAGRGMQLFDERGAAFGQQGIGSSPMKRKRRESGEVPRVRDVATPPRSRGQQPQSPASAPPRTGGCGMPQLGQANRHLPTAQAPMLPSVFSHKQE